LEIGDAFLLEDARIDPHLWIVISDPAMDEATIVVISLTTLTPDKDQSCPLDVGDHPWISHATCVSYRDARCSSEAQLDALVKSGRLRPQPAASDALLTKILVGAERSEELPLKCRRVLSEQGLIQL
jgi:hypothetical protein